MNQSGFSLLQVIFASTVLGALSIQGLKMMKEQEKLALITTQRFEIKYIFDEMTEVLKNPRSCLKTFEGLTTKNNSQIHSLKHVFDDSLTNQESILPLYFTFESSQRLYGQNTVKIHDYKIERTGTAFNLKVIFDRLESGQYNRFFIKEIPLNAVFHPTGELKSCSLSATLFSESLWQSNALLNDSSISAISPQTGKSLNIGKDKHKAQLTIDTLLRAQLSGDKLPKCDEKHNSSLVYHIEKDSYFFCENNEWKDLRNQNLNLHNYKDIVVGRDESLRESLEAKFCGLQKKMTSSGLSRCQMSPEMSQENLDMNLRKWEMGIRKAPADDSAECIYRCYL